MVIKYIWFIQKNKLINILSLICITDSKDIDDATDMTKLKKAILKYLNNGYVFR